MRIELKYLDNKQLLNLINKNSIKELSDYFKISERRVYIEIDKVFKANKTRAEKAKNNKYQRIDQETNLNTKVSLWKGSKEQEYYLKHLKPKFNNNIGSWRSDYKKLILNS